MMPLNKEERLVPWSHAAQAQITLCSDCRQLAESLLHFIAVAGVGVIFSPIYLK